MAELYKMIVYWVKDSPTKVLNVIPKIRLGKALKKMGVNESEITKGKDRYTFFITDFVMVELTRINKTN